MFFKPSLRDRVSFFLGLVLFLPGLYLQCFPPRPLLHYDDISMIFMVAGYTLWQFGTYRFVPLILFTTALTLALIIHSQVSHTVSLVIIAISIVIGLWGWRRERKTQIPQKKLN